MHSNKDYIECCLIGIRFYKLIGEIAVNYIEIDPKIKR